MRIGLVIQSAPQAGGVHQYAAMIAASLLRLRADDVLFFGGSLAEVVPSPAERIVPSPSGLWAYVRRAILSVTRTLAIRGCLDPRRIVIDPVMHSHFRRQQPDFLLYPATTATTFEAGCPYIVAIHDVNHRLHPEFVPHGEKERREYMFGHSIGQALLLLAGSELVKQDVLSVYGDTGISADRIHVLPYLPPPYIKGRAARQEVQSVRQRYKLPDRYLFYPAQFWPHKNHLRVVQALAELRREKIDIPVIFTGSTTAPDQRRHYEALIAEIQRCEVAGLVHILGPVPHTDIAALYSGATALIMPTFFWPDNIPFLEAWACECPVITSDVRDRRAQVGGAALLVDPASVGSIAASMARVWTDSQTAAKLAAEGKRQLAAYTASDFDARLQAALDHAETLVRTASNNR
jgi:glycosyltransferase involved in cell wall biosynthesis